MLEKQSLFTAPFPALAPRNISRAVRRGLVAALLLTSSHLVFAATELAPQLAGSFGTGDGANGRFLKIDDAWHASTVVWAARDPNPIGTYSWGSGLWGRADFNTVQQAFLGGGGPAIQSHWSGLVPGINFADSEYNTLYSGAWGAATLAPHLNSAASEDNWTSLFSGFIRITQPGDYNFSVLNDDGFFFRLVGQGGQSLEIGRDFLNPRERNGFDQDLALSEGLYGFELGAWDRIEAGVVDLRWQLPGQETWTLVPTEHLVSAVPDAPTLTLAALGLLLITTATRRRTRAAAT